MARFTIVGALSVKRLTDKMIFLIWSSAGRSNYNWGMMINED
jgi:hypothetical protein